MLTKLDLKWQISIILTIIVVLVMGAVGFFTYSFTQDIMGTQIDDKISLIRQSQSKEVLDKFERYKKRVQQFSASGQIPKMLNMSDFYIEDGAFKDMEEAGMWVDVLEKNTTLLKENNSKLEETAFSYVTNSDGMVMVDSRTDLEEGDVYQIAGEHLAADKYKDIVSDKVYTFDGAPYILFHSPITQGSGDSEKIIGHYVTAVNLSLFYNYSLMRMDSIGEFKLINTDSYIISSLNRSSMGQKIDDPWISEVLASGNSNATTTNSENKRYYEQISGQYNISMVIDVPLSEIDGPVNQIRNIIAVIAGLGILILFISAFLLIYFKLKPLDKLITSFEELGNGKLVESIMLADTAKRNDEIGKISKAFN